MAGMLVDERVAAEAVLEPEMAPKPAPAKDVAMASPPGIRPIMVDAHLNRSSAALLTMTNSAMSRNMGTVMSSYPLVAGKGTVSRIPSMVFTPPTKYRPMLPAMASAKATGMPRMSMIIKSDVIDAASI